MKTKVLELLGLSGFELHTDMAEEMKQPVGRLRRHAKQIVAAALVLAMTVPGFTTNLAMALSNSDILQPVMVERQSDGKSEMDPTIEIETNFVQDIYGDLTGIVEVGIRVKSPVYADRDATGAPVGTPVARAVRSINTNLVYDATILHPVSWSWIKGVDYNGSPYDVDPDATEFPYGKTETMKASTVESAAAQIGAPYDPATMTTNVQNGDQGLLGFSTTAFAESVFEDMTTIAVIRFALEDRVMPHLTNAGNVLLYDGAVVADTAALAAKMGASYHIIDFADQQDTENAGSLMPRALTYSDDYTRLNFIPDYHVTWDTESVTRSINGTNYNLDRPNTPQTPSKGAGTIWMTDPLILAKRDVGGTATYSYTSNIIWHENITFPVVSKPSFAANNDGGDGTTILFFDWDNKLLGTMVVPPDHDVRQMVSDYVAENFVHEDINEVSELTGGVASLKRTDSYRGRYPHTAPGDAGNTVTNGADFPLTNKLDYTFFKRQMVKENMPYASDFPGDDAGYQAALAAWEAASATSNKWEQVHDASGNADLSEVEKYPFAFGWAECTVNNYEDTWTTMGVQGNGNRGEFSGYTVDSSTGVATVEYVPGDKSPEFKFADLKKGVSGDTIILKAIYEAGDELDRLNHAYLSYGPVYYGQYGNVDSTTAGTSYVVRFGYERVTVNDEFGRGVPRVREPNVRVAFYPVVTSVDPVTEQTNVALGNPFYMKVPVDNVDVMAVEINPASEINKLGYHLVDGYSVNYVTGLVRSVAEENPLEVLPNFDLTNWNYPNQQGSEGFVFEGTFMHLKELGLDAIKSGSNADLKNFTVTMPLLKDLNLRKDDGSGGSKYYETMIDTLYLCDQLMALFEYAYNNEPDPAKKDAAVLGLDYHQVQYHLWTADTAGNSPVIASALMTPAQCIAAFPGGAGVPWCKLHGDKTCTNADLGNEMDINNWSELLAAINAAVGGNGKALNKLTNGLLKNTFYLAMDGTGAFSTDDDGLAAVKTALKAAVSAINTAGGATAYQNLTWGQVQYYLINGSFPGPITQADTIAEKDYWWVNGGTEGAADVSELLTAVERALDTGFTTPDGLMHTGGWSANLNTVAADMDKVTNAPLKLRQSEHTTPDDGKAFATGDDFINAIKAVANEAKGMYSTNWTDANNLGDWDTLQYNLIHYGATGTYYPKTPAVTTEANDDYWWKYGNEVVDWVTLMEAADGTCAHGATAATDPTGQLLGKVQPSLLSQTTFDTGKVGIWLRKDEMGNPFTSGDMTAFVNTLKTAAADLAALGKTMKDDMTWETLQYMLDTGANYATASAATSAINDKVKDHYWWNNGEAGVTTYAELLDAAKEAYGTDGTDGAKAKLSSILYNGVPGDLAKDFQGTPYPSTTYVLGTTPAADLADRQALVDLMFTSASSNVVDAAVSAGFTTAQFSATYITWEQLQYFFLHGAFGTNAVMTAESKGTTGRNGYYWWSPNASTWGTVGKPVNVTTASPTAKGGSFNPNGDPANSMMADLTFRDGVNRSPGVNDNNAWNNFDNSAATNMRFISGFAAGKSLGGLVSATTKAKVDADLVFATSATVRDKIDTLATNVVPDWKSDNSLSGLGSGYGYTTANKTIKLDWYVYQYAILNNGSLPDAATYAKITDSNDDMYYWWLEKDDVDTQTGSKLDAFLDAWETDIALSDPWSGETSSFTSDILKDMELYVDYYGDGSTFLPVGANATMQSIVLDRLYNINMILTGVPSENDENSPVSNTGYYSDLTFNMTWYQVQWIFLQPYQDAWSWGGGDCWGDGPILADPQKAYDDVIASGIAIPTWVSSLAGPAGVTQLPTDRLRASASTSSVSFSAMSVSSMPKATSKVERNDDGSVTTITTTYTASVNAEHNHKHEVYHTVKTEIVNGISIEIASDYTVHSIWNDHIGRYETHITKPVIYVTNDKDVIKAEDQGSSAPIATATPTAEQTIVEKSESISNSDQGVTAPISGDQSGSQRVEPVTAPTTVTPNKPTSDQKVEQDAEPLTPTDREELPAELPAELDGAAEDEELVKALPGATPVPKPEATIEQSSEADRKEMTAAEDSSPAKTPADTPQETTKANTDQENTSVDTIEDPPDNLTTTSIKPHRGSGGLPVPRLTDRYKSPTSALLSANWRALR